MASTKSAYKGLEESLVVTHSSDKFGKVGAVHETAYT